MSAQADHGTATRRQRQRPQFMEGRISTRLLQACPPQRGLGTLGGIHLKQKSPFLFFFVDRGRILSRKQKKDNTHLLFFFLR